VGGRDRVLPLRRPDGQDGQLLHLPRLRDQHRLQLSAAHTGTRAAETRLSYSSRSDETRAGQEHARLCEPSGMSPEEVRQVSARALRLDSLCTWQRTSGAPSSSRDAKPCTSMPSKSRFGWPALRMSAFKSPLLPRCRRTSRRAHPCRGPTRCLASIPRSC